MPRARRLVIDAAIVHISALNCVQTSSYARARARVNFRSGKRNRDRPKKDRRVRQTANGTRKIAENRAGPVGGRAGRRSLDGRKERAEERNGRAEINGRQKSDLRRRSSSGPFDATPWRRGLVGTGAPLDERPWTSVPFHPGRIGGWVIAGATEKKVIPRGELMRVGASLAFLALRH